MSRFIEVFDAHRSDLSMPKFLSMLEEIRESLDARNAYADLHFPYFIEKRAPVSGQGAIMAYDCGYSGKVGSDGEREFDVEVAVPVQTVCPCSKAISAHGRPQSEGHRHPHRRARALLLDRGPRRPRRGFGLLGRLYAPEARGREGCHRTRLRESALRRGRRPRGLREGRGSGKLPPLLGRGREFREHPQSFRLRIRRISGGERRIVFLENRRENGLQ